MAEHEIELKLTLPATEIARFRRDPLIHRLKRGRALNRPLFAAYFDTRSQALRSNKMALRIRQEGRQRIQTLKVSATTAMGLQARDEYNAPTRSDWPDLTLIEDEAVRRAVIASAVAHSDADAGDDASFVRVFSTDVRRTLWTLRDAGNTVDVCLDLGTIEGGGRSLPVREIELELVDGSVEFLLDVAEAFSSRYGCRVLTDSKAARGYALYRTDDPEPRKSGKLELSPDMTAWQAFQAIISEGTDQLFANEPVVRQARNVEGVHQARVAVRRMRAALSAFQSVLPDTFWKPLNKDLRWLGNSLGPARDWDVFIEETLTEVMKYPDAPGPLRKFSGRCAKARKRAYRQAYKSFDSPRFVRVQFSLIRIPYRDPPTVDTAVQVGGFAGILLDERLDAVRTAAGQDPSHLDEQALHSLRIDIKKLRYVVELFENIYDAKKVKKFRTTVRRLQECLGGLNDCAVHGAMLQTMDVPDRPVPKPVRRAIESHLRESRDKGLSRLSDMWAEFSATPPFWQGT